MSRFSNTTTTGAINAGSSVDFRPVCGVPTKLEGASKICVGDATLITPLPQAHELSGGQAGKVLQGGRTRVFATDPIPARPRVRIQLGKLGLTSIRKGRLLLRVLLPRGLRVTLERDVVPGMLLELRLPIPR